MRWSKKDVGGRGGPFRPCLPCGPAPLVSGPGQQPHTLVCLAPSSSITADRVRLPCVLAQFVRPGLGPKQQPWGVPRARPQGLLWEGRDTVEAAVGFSLGACLSLSIHPEDISSGLVHTELEKPKVRGVRLASSSCLPRLQAAGHANSSAGTRERRSSALALWAISCCLTASPVKVQFTLLRGQQDGRSLHWGPSASTCHPGRAHFAQLGVPLVGEEQPRTGFPAFLGVCTTCSHPGEYKHCVGKKGWDWDLTGL